MRNAKPLTCLLVLVLAACSRGDNAGSTAFVAPGVSDPNGFAQFLNPQVSLPVGDYTIVAATFAAGETGSYTLTVTYDDGTNSAATGSWGAGSTGQSTVGNPTHTLDMAHPGGITIDLVSSSADAYLYLLDQNGAISAQDDDSGGGSNARISLPASTINSAEYAKAYYAMIDPGNNKDTLAKWQAANGFGAGDATHVVFHDVRDLGYGRNLYVRRDTVTGDVAAYVENFAVTAVPGTGYSYSALNLDAVVENDRRWHIGTNAIEYSSGPSGQKITKFYTFNPDGTRRLMADLDGRGPKAMPGVCINCHGGRTDPLQLDAADNWVFPRKGNTWARMQGIDVDALRFSDKPGFTRADQEAALKTINQIVLCTYSYNRFLPAPANPEDLCRSPNAPGEWVGDFAGAPLIKAWYGGNGMPNATFSDTYVPPDWTPLVTSIPGTDSLYSNVIAPSCRACHVLRDTENWVGLDFSYWSYTLDDALGYKERIKTHVFDRGRMPLALLVYNKFWEAGAGPGTAPAQLADALDTLYPPTPSLDPAVSPARAGGSPLQPGRPIANPGPNNRTVTTPLKLSAAASLFANTYQWSIVTPAPGSTAASLANANTARPTFNGDVDGPYVLRLVVGNGTTLSDPADTTVNVRNTPASWGSAPLPKAIRFSDIRNILQSSFTTGAVYGGAAYAGCSVCHNPGGGYDMAVFYSDANRVGNSCVDTLVYEETGPCTDAQNMHQFYLDIRARVNFADPEDSRILRKPSNHHHGGGLVPGFDLATPGGRYYYDIFLEWIMNGAPE
jgi:mono/diheme cytochrome c family protein